MEYVTTDRMPQNLNLTLDFSFVKLYYRANYVSTFSFGIEKFKVRFCKVIREFLREHINDISCFFPYFIFSGVKSTANYCWDCVLPEANRECKRIWFYWLFVISKIGEEANMVVCFVTRVFFFSEATLKGNADSIIIICLLFQQGRGSIFFIFPSSNTSP